MNFNGGFCFQQEDIRDLLSKDQGRRLELKERPDTGVYVKVSQLKFFYFIAASLSGQQLY